MASNMNFGDLLSDLFGIGKRGVCFFGNILAVLGVDGIKFCASLERDTFIATLGVFGD